MVKKRGMKEKRVGEDEEWRRLGDMKRKGRRSKDGVVF